MHQKDHAQYNLCDSGVSSRETVIMVLVGLMSGLVENLNIGIDSDTINVVAETACW